MRTAVNPYLVIVVAIECNGKIKAAAIIKHRQFKITIGAGTKLLRSLTTKVNLGKGEVESTNFGHHISYCDAINRMLTRSIYIKGKGKSLAQTWKLHVTTTGYALQLVVGNC